MQAQIDPRTGDYSGARDHHIANAVWLRIMTPLGSWWADPSLGSRLHELSREKDLSRVQLLAEQYARAALKPLVDDKRATSLAVMAQRGAGRLYLHVQIVDAAGREWSHTFERVL